MALLIESIYKISNYVPNEWKSSNPMQDPTKRKTRIIYFGFQLTQKVFESPPINRNDYGWRKNNKMKIIKKRICKAHNNGAVQHNWIDESKFHTEHKTVDRNQLYGK